MSQAESGVESHYGEGRRLFEAGVREFREGGYFEAHDLWEELWQELHGPDRLYLQGLIHLAVGNYHRENGNVRGGQSQLRKALTKIGRYPEGHWGVDTTAWKRWIALYLDGADTVAPPVGLPFDKSRFPAHLPLAAR
jgi:hypothetical protein